MSRYDTDRFIQPPDQELLCCICKGVLDTPLETPCRHVFCKVCITTWLAENNNCPTCRKRVSGRTSLQPVLSLVSNMINRLPMKCENSPHGCTRTILLEMYEYHVLACGYKPVECTNDGCGVTVITRDFCKHQTECVYGVETCSKGCEQPVRRLDLSTHSCLESLKKQVQGVTAEYQRFKEWAEETMQTLKEKVASLERTKFHRRTLSAQNIDQNQLHRQRRRLFRPTYYRRNLTDGDEQEYSAGHDNRDSTDSDNEDVESRTDSAAVSTVTVSSNSVSSVLSASDYYISSDDSSVASSTQHRNRSYDTDDLFANSENGDSTSPEPSHGGVSSDHGSDYHSNEVSAPHQSDSDESSDAESDPSWERTSRDRSTDVSISDEESENDNAPTSDPSGQPISLPLLDAMVGYRSSETDDSWTPGHQTDSSHSNDGDNVDETEGEEDSSDRDSGEEWENDESEEERDEDNDTDDNADSDEESDEGPRRKRQRIAYSDDERVSAVRTQSRRR